MEAKQIRLAEVFFTLECNETQLANRKTKMIKTSQLSWAINYWRCSTATDDNHLSLLDPIQSKTQQVSMVGLIAADRGTYHLLSSL